MVVPPMTPPKDPRGYSTLEAAKLLGCSPANLLRAIKRGTLRARQLPVTRQEWRITENDLESWRLSIPPKNTGE